MTQLYVMVPGNPQPQLLAIEEIVSRIQSGALPKTADVVRLGESKWVPAQDIPEIASKLASTTSQAGGAPPPITDPGLGAAPVVTQFEPASPLGSQAGQPSPLGSQAGQPSPLGSQAGQPSPMFASQAGQAFGVGVSPPGGTSPGASPSPLARIASKPLPKGAIIGGGAALGVLVLGIIALVWYRNSYTRGLVLEHVPDDCAELTYVDIEGIASSEILKPNLERGLKNAKEIAQDTTKSHKDKDRMEDALTALQKNGIDIKTVREVAVCIRPSEDGKKAGTLEENGLIVLGGTFRKGDPLNAIKEALEAGTGKEDLCKIEDDDIKLLKCSIDKGDKRAPFYAALLEGRVLAVSGDKKLLKSVRANKNVAKTYGADKGEHFVRFTSKDAMSYDGTYGDTKLKIGTNDTVLAVETYYDDDKGKAKLAEIKDPDAFVKKKEGYFKAAAKSCFAAAEDFDMLADSVESAKVEAYEDGAKYELKVPNKDLSKLFKRLADADLKDVEVIDRLSGCIIRTVEPPSTGYPPSFGYE